MGRVTVTEVASGIEVPYVSHSSMSGWSDCGEKSRLLKVVGMEEDPALWFVGGSAVHEATERYDKGES